MKNAICTGFLAILLGGCAASVTSHRYQPSYAFQSGGPVYALPETVFLLKTCFAVYRTTWWRADGEGKPIKKLPDGTPATPVRIEYSARVTKPVTLTTTSVPSRGLSFRLDLNELEKAGVKLTKFEVKTDARGVLSGVNIDAGDATAETVGNTLTLVGNLVGLAAVFGQPVEVEETEMVADSERMLDRPVLLSEFQMSDDVVRFDLPQSEIANLFPAKLSGDKALTAANTPSLSLKLTSDESIRTMQDKLTRLATDETAEPTSVTGLVVGIPGAAKLTVSVSGYGITTQDVTIANLRGLITIPAGHGMLRNRTTGLVVDPVTGAVTSFSRTSDSAAANSTKLLADASAQALTIARDAATADEVEATRRLNADYALSEAEKNLRTSEKAVEALRNPDPTAAETARLTAEQALLAAQTNLAKALAANDPDLVRLITERARVEAELELIKKQKELAEAQKP